MASIINNEKGFLIIEASSEYMINHIGHFGQKDYCGNCLKGSEVYYYIPLLDKWLCKDCYKEWYESNEHKDEELYVEIRNFNNMKKKLGLA